MSPSFDKLASSDYGLIRSLFLIVIALVLSYTPIGIATVLDPKSTSVDVFSIVILLAFSNHCINWIIYGALAKNFRLGYKRLLLGLARFWTFSDKANADNISRVSEHTRTSRKSIDNSSVHRKTSRKSSKDEQPPGHKLSFFTNVETKTYLSDSIEQITDLV
jgi:hypothetical protein